MKITRIIWLQDIVEKLQWKHNVGEQEVIEVLQNQPKFQCKEAGYKAGDDIYVAFGQTDTGRFLSVFFFYTQEQSYGV